METKQRTSKQVLSSGIYEQLSINQIINPDAPKIQQNLPSNVRNLKNSSTVKCFSNYVSLYAIKEKRKVLKQQSQYMKHVVKSVHVGLVKYAKNSKYVGNLVGEPKAERQWRLLGKTIGTTKWNNQEVRVDCKYNVPLSIKYSNLKEAEIQNEREYMKSLEKQKESRKIQPLISKMQLLLRKISNRISPEARMTMYNRPQYQISQGLNSNFVLQTTQTSFTNSPCLSPQKKSFYCKRKYKFDGDQLNCRKISSEKKGIRDCNSTFHVTRTANGKQNSEYLQKRRMKKNETVNGTLPF